MRQNQKVSLSLGKPFRDPSGQVFQKSGIIYRSISSSYREDWQHLIKSGLYKKLIGLNLLIPHRTVKLKYNNSYKTIKPTHIPFIFYPYEWCFSQLKDAALTTLKIQKVALEYEMSLKDASGYNIQFFKGKPILIDSLSFEKYKESQPWIAYRQFCMHFLAPLLLIRYKSVELNKLLRIYIDGIPLNLASSLLPLQTWLKPSILTHIHLHSKSQTFFQNKETNFRKTTMGKLGMLGLIENLESIINGLTLKISNDGWVNYYQNTNYTQKAFTDKKRLISELIKATHPNTIWDLGANTGQFSHIAASLGIKTVVALDFDPLAVELNYLHCKKNNLTNCLPLVFDLTNPSPPIGWNNQERMSLNERGPADTVLALALVHHLVIGNNIPFKNLAYFLSQISKNLIIEFIPKEDLQVQRLLINREDIFNDYKQKSFELNFSKHFYIKQVVKIKDSARCIYLMGSKSR